MTGVPVAPDPDGMKPFTTLLLDSIQLSGRLMPPSFLLSALPVERSRNEEDGNEPDRDDDDGGHAGILHLRP